MNVIFDDTYALIDLDILSANFRVIREKAGVPVMAVIKADAYGHGAVTLARHLEQDCGFFAVSSLAEAMELRNAGIQTPILVFGHIAPASYETAVRHKIRPTIYHYEDAAALSEAAEKLGVIAPFHIAVDTGMSRIGFQVTTEDVDICARMAQLPGIEAEGIFSHFATADCADLTAAKVQAALFDRFCEMLQQRGVTVKLRHLDNSAGIMNFESHYEMVRSGIVTYGLYPSDEVSPQLLPIAPILSWHSRIAHIKQLPAGRPISYGGTYVTEKPTLVATISVGYADGYRRSLSNRFHVLIRGHKCPILGRVCMDQLMVDVTEVPNAAIGDAVVLIGKDGSQEITMDDMASALDTINYEIATGISRRVPRYYRKDGKIVHTVHYLLDT